MKKILNIIHVKNFAIAYAVAYLLLPAKFE